MSDHCVHCDYDHKESIGTDACPFNALYWDFLARNVSILHNVPRMGLMLSLLGRKDADELRAIRRRADVLIDGIQAGIHF
jgi:deoxyribodipyrimidine photolyase-related protein